MTYLTMACCIIVMTAMKHLWLNCYSDVLHHSHDSHETLMAKLLLRRVGEPYCFPQMQFSIPSFLMSSICQALLLPKLEGGLGRWIKLFDNLWKL